MKAQSTSAILDELNYRSYCQQRMLAPHVPSERWVRIFPEWAEFEERFVHQFVSCLILAAEDLEGLPTADGTKPPAQMAQGADIGKSGEVSTASPLQHSGTTIDDINARVIRVMQKVGRA